MACCNWPTNRYRMICSGRAGFILAEGDLTGYADGPLPDPRGGQAWLASRLPEVNSPALPADKSSNRPYWRYLSGPLMGDHFDSPCWPGGAPVGYSTRRWAIPDAVSLPDGGSPHSGFSIPPTGRSRRPSWPPTRMATASPTRAWSGCRSALSTASPTTMPFASLTTTRL